MADMLYGPEHVARYEATGGAEGYEWQGTVTLLLHTTGRKSGRDYTHPLIFQPYDDAYLIVASKGGDPSDPEWYRNLQKDPNVQVQIKDETFPARARTATSNEKPDMWATMTRTWPDYDEYQKKTDREIPIVVLERV
jgi:deazaflavin-dependent oxidoreductase (nitroreductase family)